MNKCGVISRIAVRARGALLVPCLAGLLCTAASAATYYVATNGSDAAAGTNWDTAFQKLNYAVSILTNNSTVYISNGTHSITGMLTVPNKGLMQFVGVGGAENTIVDGQGTFPGFRGYRLILDGLTMSNCNSADYGAGCFITPNSPGNIVKNCVFVNCVSASSGGVMI